MVCTALFKQLLVLSAVSLLFMTCQLSAVGMKRGLDFETRLTDLTGDIESPNFPDNYPDDARATWNLWVPEGLIIIFTFHSFDVEYSTMCFYDYVRVLDGSRASGHRLGTWCGDDLPPVLRSSSNSMTVEFYSDGQVNRPGFSATYHSINETDECGGHLTGVTGSFTSPHYPLDYPSDTTCTWHIEVPSGDGIELVFSSFEVEWDVSCGYDFVQVWEVEEGQTVDEGSDLGRFCGHEEPSIGYRTRSLVVQFTSDENVNKRDLKLRTAYRDSDVIWGVNPKLVQHCSGRAINTETFI